MAYIIKGITVAEKIIIIPLSLIEHIYEYRLELVISNCLTKNDQP